MDVLGSFKLKRPPETKRNATLKIGTAQLTSIRYPKTTLPKIAPNLATAKETAIAVDLTCVGNNSIPRQSKELNPIVETKPNTIDKARLAPALFTR